MPQNTFHETKYDEIIRLDTKAGWYNGNRMASADLPGYLKVPRGKTGPGIPSLEEEIDAYHRGYAEGMAAREEGKSGADNPYTHDNVLKRMGIG